MLYMRGSSTDDSFMRNRLTYKGAKCCERTGRKSQYFTLISVVTGHCVCLCVFCHTNSKNFCFVYYYGSSSHRRTCLGLSVDAPPAPSPSLSPSSPRFLFTLPGMFGRKAPSAHEGLLDVSPDEPHTHTAVRAHLGVTAEMWRWWAEGDAHTKHVCITYADTLNSHKEHCLSSLSKVRLDDQSQAVQTANDSQTCFHGLLLVMLMNCNEYCRNMTDTIYFNSTAIKSCQGGTPL